MKTLVSIIFLPHMVKLVQVKVFFCFPASEVPTFVGSPDCRESQLTAEVPTTTPSPFLTGPVLSFTTVISSSSPPVTPPPPSLLLVPPRRALPPPPHFLVGGLAGCPDSPSPLFYRPSFHFSFGSWCTCDWCGGESFGGGDCARGFVRRRLRLIFLHPFPRFKVLPWCLNPNFNVPCVLTPFFLFLSSSISLVCVCVVI